MKVNVNNYNKKRKRQRELCTFSKDDDIGQSETGLNRKALLLSAMLISFISISGCSNSDEYLESSADTQSSQTELEAFTSDSIDGILSEDSADATSNIKPSSNRLSVENLSSNNEQVLGSQAADIQIAGKELLVTANVDFKVEDVVKSSEAIEELTRQQRGYVALSNISNHPRESRTFVQGDKDITLTTYTRQADMIVRIPRVSVNEFLAQLQQQVAFLNEHQFSAQDVTLDIYRKQLASQLNKEMASELSQERLDSENNEDQSSNVDAITATYAARRQQALAQLEQMDIADKVKYSTIGLTFMQPDISYKETTQNLDVLLDAERPSFSAQVKQALEEGWEVLRSVALGLIQLWWLLVLGIIVYLTYRIIKTTYHSLARRNLPLNRPKPQQIVKGKNSQEKSDDGV